MYIYLPYLVQLIPNSFWLAFCKQRFFCFHSARRISWFSWQYYTLQAITGDIRTTVKLVMLIILSPMHQLHCMRSYNSLTIMQVVQLVTTLALAGIGLGPNQLLGGKTFSYELCNLCLVNNLFDLQSREDTESFLRL